MKKKFSFIITFILVISIFLIPNNVFAKTTLNCEYDTNQAGLDMKQKISIQFVYDDNVKECPNVSVSTSEVFPTACSSGGNMSYKFDGYDLASCASWFNSNQIANAHICPNNIYLKNTTNDGNSCASTFSIYFKKNGLNEAVPLSSQPSVLLKEIETEACSDYALAEILYIVKIIMTIIKIISPILAIFAFTIYLFKAVINPDDKKSTDGKKFLNIAIALMIVFLLQFIIQFTISLAGYTFDFDACWNSAVQIHDLYSDD